MIGAPAHDVGIGADLVVVVELITGRYPRVGATVVLFVSLVGICGHVLTLCPSSLHKEHGIFLSMFPASQILNS